MKSETRQIGEHTYTVMMLPLSQWQQLRDAIWPTLMGVIPDIIDHADAPTAEQLTDVVQSASVLLPLQGEAYRAALKVLQACSQVEGRPGYISNIAELWWSDTGYAELGGWLAFALEVQFVPFLCGLPFVGLHRLVESTRSQSPLTLSGRSGGLSAGGMVP